MKLNIKKIKAAGKKALDSGYEYAKETSQAFKSYFQSEDYESDLDEVIAKLNVLQLSKARKFEHIKNRKLRIGLKTQFVLSQARFLVVSSAAIGAELGLIVGGPQGALTGGTVGTAFGAVCVTVVAGKIIVKRITDTDYLAGRHHTA